MSPTLNLFSCPMLNKLANLIDPRFRNTEIRDTAYEICALDLRIKKMRAWWDGVKRIEGESI